MNLISILTNSPFWVGFKAGNKFLDRYRDRYKEITDDEEGLQRLSNVATRAKQLYLYEIASLNGYNPFQTLILKLGFQLGSD